MGFWGFCDFWNFVELFYAIEMRSSDFKNLDVWKLSMNLAFSVYGLIRSLPKEEKFGLCDQMRRAAVSVPSNIAEGQSRNSAKEFIHFLSMSRGSLAELETQLLLCVGLGYVQEGALTDIFLNIGSIGRMIKSLMNTLENPTSKNRPSQQPTTQQPTTQQPKNLTTKKPNTPPPA